jgi:hypothetical protein
MAQSTPVVLVIGSQSSSLWTWLGPVLTFCGSVLLFIAAMITLWRTNNAADWRAAQERQNERDRDFRLWQRDTLLPLGYEIVEVATEAPHAYNRLRQSQKPPAR